MPDIVAYRFDEAGRILETLYDDGKGNLDHESEVNEYDENLWVGSVSLPYVSIYNYKINAHLGNYRRLNFTSVLGPKSVSFDCKGEGPYAGVSDGRILKWKGKTHGWVEFAVTSQQRNREVCDGTSDPNLENSCGRPMGLQFNNATCDLYISDAYFGLVVVGSNGGVAKLLANSAEGVPFRFTNSVEVDKHTGTVYFTDSSTRYQRRQYIQCMLSGDSTGRLMKYDPKSKKVTVLLRGLTFANGVALSKDKSFLLVAETTTKLILKYWLKGSKAQTSEVFKRLPSYPDNIRRNAKGEFWVAMVSGQTNQTTPGVVAYRLNKKGRILETLYDDGKGNLDQNSEVHEYDEKLWISSVSLAYVSAYNYKV
ncbi:hypothetical protein NE237_021861 [Protea cynaroides]|uniref:Strictosidine synthase conserved region domain-containing protein n=1 Tax=Protea cynaroides TaxID=273540 RepID=A0A9Q0K3N7_9MAGN|nr:hypothetical protein NE237_021861 [Protea cynaroides]